MLKFISITLGLLFLSNAVTTTAATIEGEADAEEEAEVDNCARLDIVKINGAPSVLVEYNSVRYLRSFIDGKCKAESQRDTIGRLVDLTYLSERLAVIPSSAFFPMENYEAIERIKAQISRELNRTPRLPNGSMMFSGRDVGVVHMLICQVDGAMTYNVCDDELFGQMSSLGETWSAQRRAEFLEDFISLPEKKKTVAEKTKREVN